MIDPRRFSRGAILDSKALKDVTVRRLKKDLTGKAFKDRKVNALPFTPWDALTTEATTADRRGSSRSSDCAAAAQAPPHIRGR